MGLPFDTNYLAALVTPGHSSINEAVFVMEYKSLLLVLVLVLAQGILQLSLLTVLAAVSLSFFFFNIKQFVRLSMHSEGVRRFAHRYVAWTIVWFRIKFFRGYSWYSEIDDTVILGALPIPSNVPELQRARVKLIITLCEPFELDFIYSREEFERMGFVNKRFSVPDSYGAPDIPALVDILSSIAATEKQGYKTYVHCKAGRGRSASTVICYLIFRYNISVEWALSILKRRRLEVSPKPQQLLRARQFREVYSSVPELAAVSFRDSDWLELESARFRYALRHIMDKRPSMPDCNSIIYYRNRISASVRNASKFVSSLCTLSEEEEQEGGRPGGSPPGDRAKDGPVKKLRRRVSMFY